MLTPTASDPRGSFVALANQHHCKAHIGPKIYNPFDTQAKEPPSIAFYRNAPIIHLAIMSTTTFASATTTRTAASRTCATAELLEMILLQADPVDVTRARQINPFFKNLIDRSKGLRQAMFLEPKSPQATPSPTKPILDGSNSHRATLHPIFFAISSPTSPAVRNSTTHHGHRYEFNAPALLSWPRGSWEEMLINGFSNSHPSLVYARFGRRNDIKSMELASNASLGDLRRCLIRAQTRGQGRVIYAQVMIVDRTEDTEDVCSLM